MMDSMTSMTPGDEDEYVVVLEVLQRHRSRKSIDNKSSWPTMTLYMAIPLRNDP